MNIANVCVHCSGSLNVIEHFVYLLSLFCTASFAYCTYLYFVAMSIENMYVHCTSTYTHSIRIIHTLRTNTCANHLHKTIKKETGICILRHE